MHAFFIFHVVLYAFQEQKGEILMQVVNMFISNYSSQITSCSIGSKHFLKLTSFSSCFLGDEEMIMPLKQLYIRGLLISAFIHIQDIFFQYEIFFLSYLCMIYNKLTFNIYTLLVEQIKSTPAGDISVVLTSILRLKNIAFPTSINGNEEISENMS